LPVYVDVDSQFDSHPHCVEGLTLILVFIRFDVPLLMLAPFPSAHYALHGLNGISLHIRQDVRIEVERDMYACMPQISPPGPADATCRRR
jgi:hypothetical protein